MKYCVFGVNKDKKYYRIAAKNNLSYNPYDFIESKHSFEFAVNSNQYKKVFFLVDFGYMEKDPHIFKSVAIDSFDYNPIPWLLISKYDGNIENDSSEFTLIQKGFKEYFKNIEDALSRYNFYISNSYKSELYIKLEDKDIFISNSILDIHKIKCPLKEYYCKYYKIKG